ncbi:titin-like isoform x2 [Plakobranchus ocellatus]|uniref:Titin-like isoform x2 n=1 Tax=Plakobranchus ocellatus TaxID=259542 RepID=A0AAV4DJH1_9GAST|nr:titin-like isoform x2 [Plakobranchus ocellatus]
MKISSRDNKGRPEAQLAGYVWLQCIVFSGKTSAVEGRIQRFRSNAILATNWHAFLTNAKMGQKKKERYLEKFTEGKERKTDFPYINIKPWYYSIKPTIPLYRQTPAEICDTKTWGRKGNRPCLAWLVAYLHQLPKSFVPMSVSNLIATKRAAGSLYLAPLDQAGVNILINNMAAIQGRRRLLSFMQGEHPDLIRIL